MTSSRVLRGGMAAALAAGALAGVSAAPASAASARAGCTYHASFHAPNHHPKANRNWLVRVRVSPASLDTHMKYQFVFSGRVVATRYVRNHKNFHFRGRMSDAVVWPKRAIGIPLVFRVVLHNRCGTKRWNWRVNVHK